MFDSNYGYVIQKSESFAFFIWLISFNLKIKNKNIFIDIYYFNKKKNYILLISLHYLNTKGFILAVDIPQLV